MQESRTPTASPHRTLRDRQRRRAEVSITSDPASLSSFKKQQDCYYEPAAVIPTTTKLCYFKIPQRKSVAFAFLSPKIVRAVAVVNNSDMNDKVSFAFRESCNYSCWDR